MHGGWGNVAEWVGGVGALAGLGLLLFAYLQWQGDQAKRRQAQRHAEADRFMAEQERRDCEAAQARLIIAEPFDNDREARVGLPEWSAAPVRGTIDIEIVNNRDLPVFDLAVAVHHTTQIGGLDGRYRVRVLGGR